MSRSGVIMLPHQLSCIDESHLFSFYCMIYIREIIEAECDTRERAADRRSGCIRDDRLVRIIPARKVTSLN